MTYVVVSLVYAPLMFFVRESKAMAVFIVFSVQLIMVAVIFGFRALSSLRMRRAYELLMLRTASEPTPTNEMIWGDRLAELRQIGQHRLLFDGAELWVWLMFAAMVYFLQL
jgi:hypothetical protein